MVAADHFRTIHVQTYDALAVVQLGAPVGLLLRRRRNLCRLDILLRGSGKMWVAREKKETLEGMWNFEVHIRD